MINIEMNIVLKQLKLPFYIINNFKFLTVENSMPDSSYKDFMILNLRLN